MKHIWKFLEDTTKWKVNEYESEVAKKRYSFNDILVYTGEFKTMTICRK